MSNRRRAAALTVAALVMVSFAGASTANAFFSATARSAPQSASTASLEAVSSLSAEYQQSGRATVEWDIPTIRPDVAPAYTVQRSIDGEPAVTLNPSINASGATARFDDDLAVPATIDGVTVTDVSAGTEFACAIAGGQAYCWGKNHVGQLGNGSQGASSPTPVHVSGLIGMTVTAVSAGFDHACAIADGLVFCWGFGAHGQLGDGGQENQFSPVQATGALAGQTATALAAGNNHTCALAGGAAYCWGFGERGQLGDGQRSNHASPVAVSTIGALNGRVVSDITAGGEQTCAIAEGDAFCWGVRPASVGDDILEEDFAVLPVAIDDAAWSSQPVTAISSGMVHSCAIANGAAYCWGRGWQGELGNGAAGQSIDPVPVDTSGLLAGVSLTDIDAGTGHSCALATGVVYCWGARARGSLGDGLITPDSFVPVPVSASTEFDNAGVSRLALGYYSSCAVAGGAAYCWGWNSAGQLGDGTTRNRLVPRGVAGPLAHQSCAADWLLAGPNRCVPGEDVPVEYEVDYAKAGWSPAVPSTAVAAWSDS